MALSLTQVGGALLIFGLCPALGAMPLIDWIVQGLTGKRLKTLGTGNVSVSAAFMYGGKTVGILCALAEALKGIGSVLLARYFFPTDPVWELFALIALVMGRYWAKKGAGTTNLFWGMVAHDWIGTLLVTLIGGGSFTIFRDRSLGRLIVLGLLVFILSVRHPTGAYAIAIMSLAVTEAWILQQVPDDLDVSATEVDSESRRVFRFFRGENALKSLSQPLDPQKVGAKAATLAYLKGLGYAVPDGWIFFAGDDPQPLMVAANPSADRPLVVRSSAIGEDGDSASSAGQYLSLLDITDPQSLESAIFDCIAAYDRPSAVQYRRDRQLPDAEMVVLVQKQIRGAFSGVVFSRDPVNPLSGNIAIEALPGGAERVVSGKFTPERYSAAIDETGAIALGNATGDVPRSLLEAVAKLARDIENLFQGIPQDIEWTYDGDRLWLLQARPIATLQPIWTRKIAAEVIPGTIRPLPWSINQPLTCGVWGTIFQLVLGNKAADLDFNATATLHFQRAYFNATLLGQIFRRMGLPPESLEFLTRGAKFSKPPLIATLGNLAGLGKLLQRERQLIGDFSRDRSLHFAPLLADLKASRSQNLSPLEYLDRISAILKALERATYYSILAPLSFSLRQQLLKVDPIALDNTQTPEVISLQELEIIARKINENLEINCPETDLPQFKTAIACHPLGSSILEQFEQWCDRYGYLSETATDISVPRWADHPDFCWNLLRQYCQDTHSKPDRHPRQTPSRSRPKGDPNWRQRIVQQRLNIKGEVSSIYSQLLAYLRWNFLVLGDYWLKAGWLENIDDLFFLEFSEIKALILHPSPKIPGVFQKISQRKAAFDRNRSRAAVPYLVYGYPTDDLVDFESSTAHFGNDASSTTQIQGIGASPGKKEGTIKIIKSFAIDAEIDKNTILVVPYTDSGWTMLLAKAGGIISEVGGSLSHGAIVAREYGIPAVMDVPHATQRLRDGQRVQIDGKTGIIEILRRSLPD